MFTKFLVLCVIPFHFAVGSTEENHFSSQNGNTIVEIADIEALESSLHFPNCDKPVSNVRKLLGFYQKNKMTQEKIADKFDCSPTLVSKFLDGKNPAFCLVDSVHSYYINGGISLLQQIKENEASTWHFSDALSWLPFGRRSTSASSTRSSNEGTPQNDYLSSRGSTPPKAVEDPDKKPLLEKHETIQKPNEQSGLRRRHLSADSDKQ